MKSTTKWLTLGIAVGLAISLTTVYVLIIIGTLQLITTQPTHPQSLAEPEIIRTTTDIVSHTQGIPEGPVFHMTVGITNNGGPGWIKICVVIHGYGRYQIKERETQLQEGSRIKTLAFDFGLSDWELPEDPQINHQIWAAIP